jgi:hypothetical protein
VVPPASSVDFIGLLLRYQNPASATSGGDEGFISNQANGTVQYRILRRSNGETMTTFAMGTGPALVAGDKLLLRAIGTSLELWRMTGGTWSRVLTATDSASPTSGYVGLHAKNTTVRLDDFGGGTLP